jgi:hypothetical protein
MGEEQVRSSKVTPGVHVWSGLVSLSQVRSGQVRSGVVGKRF